MKKLLLSLILVSSAMACFAQKSFMAYEDLKYILHNNIQKADTFLMAKGYTASVKNIKNKTRVYTMNVPGGTHVIISLRADGKKLFMELETNELQQFDLIKNSIDQFPHVNGTIGDMQTITIKDFCTIYVTVNESVPYDPLRKVYVMQIIPDKSVTAYD